MEIFKGTDGEDAVLACYCQYKCEGGNPHCTVGLYNYGTIWDSYRAQYAP